MRGTSCAFSSGSLRTWRSSAQAGDGIEALGLLEDLEPDLAFLDIQMPGLTGFEVAQQALARNPPPEFVFVTAYDHYALDAFHVNAVDYLLKPVDAARLERALARPRRRMPPARRPTASRAPNSSVSCSSSRSARPAGRRWR